MSSEIASARIKSFSSKEKQAEVSPSEDLPILVSSTQQIGILKQIIDCLETDIIARIERLEADQRQRQGEQPASESESLIGSDPALAQPKAAVPWPPTKDKTKAILDIIKNVPLDYVLDRAVELGMERSRAEEIITRLKRDGSVMEPKHRMLQVV